MRGLWLQVHTWRRLNGLSSLWKNTSCHVTSRVRCTGELHRTVHEGRISSPCFLPSSVLGKQGAGQLGGQYQSLFVLPVRFKGSKSAKKSSKKKTQEEEDEETDPEESDCEEELQDDPGLPRDYRDLEKAVQSFRYDLIMKAGLDMARNKVEDAFYSTKLRLNGQKLIKKSKTVKVGDILDLVVEEDKDTDTVTLMRVIFKKVSGETKDSEKYKVILRRWKNLKLPKQEAFKQ
ncbi:mitochondrial transcription rescue factor 1 [Lepisosteus oculatus]|uniref:Mitochondrial transcription rescue factor 1 n=1 Tax=Lepisosteus oculatus TaxID=7918 RepID=W5NIM5_LEPOC|nr:PREDICTED: uncharacterized protein C6orf203 homolog [Lepisosteus oculatus]